MASRKVRGGRTGSIKAPGAGSPPGRSPPPLWVELLSWRFDLSSSGPLDWLSIPMARHPDAISVSYSNAESILAMPQEGDSEGHLCGTRDDLHCEFNELHRSAPCRFVTHGCHQSLAEQK